MDDSPSIDTSGSGRLIYDKTSKTIRHESPAETAAERAQVEMALHGVVMRAPPHGPCVGCDRVVAMLAAVRAEKIHTDANECGYASIAVQYREAYNTLHARVTALEAALRDVRKHLQIGGPEEHARALGKVLAALTPGAGGTVCPRCRGEGAINTSCSDKWGDECPVCHGAGGTA